MKGTFAIPGIPEATGRLVDSLPSELVDAVSLYPFWQARQSEMLLRVPSVGTFRVANGRTVEIARSPAAHQYSVDVYLNGTVRAALIQQRGEIAFQAATLSPPGGEFAVAVCGAAVVGKSTLATELCRRGWSLLADDLTRLQCSSTYFMAWPSDTTIKLWKDACEAFSIPTTALQRVRPDVERFVVPVPVQTAPLPLKLIVQLRPKGAGLERTIPPIDKMVLLNRYVFRRKQIAALGMASQHSANIMRLAAATSVGTLHGSRTQSVRFNADKIEEALTWSRP